MTISVQAFPAFVQRSETSDLTAVIVSVADTAPPTNIQIAICDASGNPAALAGWTNVGNTSSSNTYSINCPVGGPWYPAARILGPNTIILAPTGTLFGDIRAYLGQSNASNMWSISSGSYTPNTTTSMWTPSVGWATPTGDGLISFLNQLSMVGVPLAVIAAAQGSTALTADGAYYTSQALGPQNGYWLYTQGSPWSRFTSSINALAHPLTPGAGQIVGVIWDQGESDSVNVSAQLYLRGLQEMWRSIQGIVTARRPPKLRFGVIPTGFYDPTPAAGYAVDARPVVEAQRKFIHLESGQGVYRVADRWDLKRDTSNVHLTAAAYAQLGQRLAFSIARQEYGLG